MNKKYFLGLALTLAITQAYATDKVIIEPAYRVAVKTKQTLLSTYQVVEITLEGLENFKGDEFRFTTNITGNKVIVRGESYRIRDEFGKLANNEQGSHYRKKFEITIDLPANVIEKLRGKTKRYSNSSSYFSYYNHKVDNTLIITIPVVSQ